jgi:hypothetical protein
VVGRLPDQKALALVLALGQKIGVVPGTEEQTEERPISEPARR